MTPERFAEIKARCEESDALAQNYDEEAAFNRADVKELLAEVERLRALLTQTESASK